MSVYNVYVKKLWLIVNIYQKRFVTICGCGDGHGSMVFVWIGTMSVSNGFTLTQLKLLKPKEELQSFELD